MTTDINIATSLEASINLSDQVAACLDGLKMPDLPYNKKLQLAMPCQHLAIEHGQAIICLVDKGLYGSALALQRPMFEAIVRGVWIRYSATDKEVEKATDGKFPHTEIMVNNSPRWEDQNSTPPLNEIKEIWWKRFCDYTHGGSGQIRARLSNSGLQANYNNADVIAALRWSDMTQLYSGVEIADAACNVSLAKEFLNCMINYEDPSEI